MEQFFVATALKYYKRREVQEAILRHAPHREISPRYGEGFGKRPDVLEHPQDVLEFAKRKATSFHCSEERWDNPLQIVTGMNRKEADDLRIGWDMVLDIDAKDWDISRLTAWLFIRALEDHDVRGFSVKFSGNKGWHIGVAFESFSSNVVDDSGKDQHTKNLFPDMPRAIAQYLLNYIGDTENGLIKVSEDEVLFGGKVAANLSDIARKAGKKKHELLEQYCPACKKSVAREKELHTLLCGSCGFRHHQRYSAEAKAAAPDAGLVCPKCKHVMDWHLVSKRECPHDPSSYHQRFKITDVIEFDTVLLASRHMYRMPYSLHEKSGLVSVVVDPESVLKFNKDDAKPENVSFERVFLGEFVSGEASGLAAKAWEGHMQSAKPRYSTKEYEVSADAIPEEFFPPCMQKVLLGLEDGKKRAMFALVNFLQVSGWEREMIDTRVHEWNEKNPEPLREVNVKGHLKQHLSKKLKILPPNCMAFYRELGVCNPDDLCRRVRNPAQYALRRSKMKKK